MFTLLLFCISSFIQQSIYFDVGSKVGINLAFVRLPLLSLWYLLRRLFLNDKK